MKDFVCSKNTQTDNTSRRDGKEEIEGSNNCHHALLIQR